MKHYDPYILVYILQKKKSSSIPSLILNNPPLKLYIRQKLITFFVLPIKEDDISGLLCTLETFLHKVCKTTLFLLSIKVNFALIISHELTIIRCAITVKFHFRQSVLEKPHFFTLHVQPSHLIDPLRKRYLPFIFYSTSQKPVKDINLPDSSSVKMYNVTLKSIAFYWLSPFVLG